MGGREIKEFLSMVVPFFSFKKNHQRTMTTATISNRKERLKFMHGFETASKSQPAVSSGGKEGGSQFFLKTKIVV